MISKEATADLFKTSEPRGRLRWRPCAQGSGLPGVHVRALLLWTLPPRAGARVEEHADPAARVGGVDDVVDLAVGGHVDALPVLVGGGHGGLERAPALLLVGDRLDVAGPPQP